MRSSCFIQCIEIVRFGLMKRTTVLSQPLKIKVSRKILSLSGIYFSITFSNTNLKRNRRKNEILKTVSKARKKPLLEHFKPKFSLILSFFFHLVLIFHFHFPVVPDYFEKLEKPPESDGAVPSNSGNLVIALRSALLVLLMYKIYQCQSTGRVVDNIRYVFANEYKSGRL